LRYYNYERLHFGINFLTPMQVVPSYWILNGYSMALYRPINWQRFWSSQK
jgi:hypothetical protein